MIKSFRHKGLKQFFEHDSLAGIQAKHSLRLRRQLTVLDEAAGPTDMDVAGWDLHQLRGEMAGVWAIKVSGNWRLTFTFEATDASLVDYRDYH